MDKKCQYKSNNSGAIINTYRISIRQDIWEIQASGAFIKL